MGAHNFYDETRAASAKEGFNQLCEDALFENGHNSYNGTISTNDSFVMIPLNDNETVSEWEQRVIDDERVQKWGPCACAQSPADPELWHFAGWASC